MDDTIECAGLVSGVATWERGGVRLRRQYHTPDVTRLGDQVRGAASGTATANRKIASDDEDIAR